MSGSDRDLVAALRAELSAVDPSRPCDRRAEIAGLGPRVRTREPAVARLVVRLGGHALDGGGVRRSFSLAEEPFDWAHAAEHCRFAWLRGRYLARGSLSLASGHAHLEFVVAGRRRRRAGGPARRRRAARVVARPARPRRGHLEERGVDHRVPRPDRGERVAARARGAPGRPEHARRAQPRAQRRVGQPAALRGGVGPAARGDRRARDRRSTGRAATDRAARSRRHGARRPEASLVRDRDPARPASLGRPAGAGPPRAARPPRRRGRRPAATRGPESRGRAGRARTAESPLA